MSDRGKKGGTGAPPFYAPKRKTSAEIISEARAAIYGDTSSAGSGAAGSGTLRPLRTRRPFTPRDPQRTLFADRTKKRDPRPPSSFNLKYLSLSESVDESTAAMVATGARIASIDDPTYNGILLTEPQVPARKKPMLKNKTQSLQDTSWCGLPKLPHLNGHSKPLHRRKNDPLCDSSKSESELASAILITQPLGETEDGDVNCKKSRSAESANTRRRVVLTSKTNSVEETCNGLISDIGVKHLAVQLPNTSSLDDYNSMSTLELAEALSQRYQDVDRTLSLLDSLQNLLDINLPATSLRDLILRTIYVHINNEDERVLVAIARIMLTLRVTGSHLAAACKLVFKIARNDKNDHFFRSTNLLELLVEGCGRACPLSEGECCVYGAGALRFLALEPRLRSLAHKAGALHLAALHLKILNTAKAENPRSVTEQSIHALYQLTGALRNLAGGDENDLKVFVASGALSELLTALKLYVTDRDVLTNVVRSLSVLSAEEACCFWLCSTPSSAGILLEALAACAASAPLAVRLTYTLGNMAALDQHARISIYNAEGAVDVLLTILESYTKRADRDPRDESDPDMHLVGSDLGGSDGSREDVLIKTVRVIANLCLCERAGRGLAEVNAERTIRALLQCLELADPLTINNMDVSESQNIDMERREELATAVLATLNNITFYREPPALPDPLDKLLDDLCSATCAWLRNPSAFSGAACEAVRALGNLSRSPRAADLIVREGALESLAPFLHHDDTSIRCAAAGVLVNICGAGSGLDAAGAASRALTDAAAQGDAITAALLARALWNANAHAPLTSVHAHQAEAALAMFIDDESIFEACDAPKSSDRRASDPEISKHHVKFDIDRHDQRTDIDSRKKISLMKAHSVDQDLYLEQGSEILDQSGCSGEDLGFEDGDIIGESCECGPCRRLAAWEELVGVAIPLLEKLRPARSDASVGTD